MKSPVFAGVLKIGRFFSGVKGLLPTTGVKNPTKIIRLHQGPPLGLTSGA
jgi:hypothetical protein